MKPNRTIEGTRASAARVPHCERYAKTRLEGADMKFITILFIALVLGGLLGCASLMADDLNAMTSFNPYITKDGKQSFRFVAKRKLPSYYGNADVQQTHESWISNELGKRQYCMKGYEIVSKTPALEDMIIYEGVCK